MNWVSGVVLYIVLWWLALFMVLPIGTRPVERPDATSGWRGTPERPLLLRKALGTTALAGVLWVLFYLLITSEWMSFRSGPFALPPPS
jgi:predicted secreted protein